MWDPTNKHNKCTNCWHFITLYLLFILYKGMMISWFNPIHRAKAYEWEYTKLCFDWCFILLSSTATVMYWECNRDELLYSYGNEWLISYPDHFTGREGAHSTKWIVGWMGLRASLDIFERSWISCPCRDLNPRSFVLYPSHWADLLGERYWWEVLVLNWTVSKQRVTELAREILVGGIGIKLDRK